MFVVIKKYEKTLVCVKWPILEIITTQTMLSSQLISFSSFSSVTALWLYTQPAGFVCCGICVKEENRRNSYFHGIFDKYTKR